MRYMHWKEMRRLLPPLLLFLAIQGSFALAYPDYVGHVNDYAHLLSATQASALNQELRDFDNRTTIEIAVVTVESIGSESPQDYAVNLGNYWGVGKRGKNNGILLLVAMQSHDIWIEVGSGLAEELEDDKVQQIVDGVIIPKFRAGQPDQGIIQGVRSIVLYLDNAGTYVQINYEGTPYSEIGSLSPDLGKKFLVVDLTIENHGYNGVDTNPYHFKVTVDNVEYGYAAWETEYLEVINKATLDSVTLKDGGKISGSLAFQVPATVTTYSFAYVPHPFENFNVKYNIL